MILIYEMLHSVGVKDDIQEGTPVSEMLPLHKERLRSAVGAGGSYVDS